MKKALQESGDTARAAFSKIGVLMASYFQDDNNEFKEYQGYVINFDTSLIRPDGAPITGGFKAPGPKGLEAALIKIENVINLRLINNFIKFFIRKCLF
jgi:hypothetical protein